VRGLAPAVVLGALVFLLLRVTVLPARGYHPDLAHAKALVTRQWIVPAIALHLALAFAGVITPWLRGARPAAAAWQSVSRLPVIWLHALAAQIMIVLGLVAGVVPGVLAIAPAALVAIAAADGARGLGAFHAADAAARRHRLLVIGVVLGAVVVEVGATIGAWKLLVPALHKKSSAAELYTSVRYAWINAIRVAVTVPLVAAALAALYASWSPQRESAARTAAASAQATTA
jgi:hypothetical protein